MIALARFIMAGPTQAAVVAAATALLAFILPPIAWVSGGVVALVVLHLGPVRGIQLMAYAGVAALVLGWLALGTPLLVVGVILLLWLPVWLASMILRSTFSLSVSLQAITGFSVALVLLLHLGFPELQTQLQHEFLSILKPVIEQQPDEVQRQNLQVAVESVLVLLPGILVTGMMSGIMLSLLLGRWWQSALYNPGGLVNEFNSLRLGRYLNLISSAFLLMALFSASELATMIVLLLLSLYLLQGVAVVHGVFELRQIAKGWLIGLYVMILFIPHLVVLPLAVFGLSDAWVDFRQRLARTH